MISFCLQRDMIKKKMEFVFAENFNVTYIHANFRFDLNYVAGNRRDSCRIFLEIYFVSTKYT